MTVFEKISVAVCFGASARERNIQNEAVDILYRTGLLRKANLPAAHSACSNASAWNWRGRWPRSRGCCCSTKIAGGLTEDECNSLIATIRGVHADGTTIVWIEHVTHVLLAVVSRLVAIDFGKIIADGEPQSVMNSEAVQRIYLGAD